MGKKNPIRYIETCFHADDAFGVINIIRRPGQVNTYFTDRIAEGQGRNARRLMRGINLLAALARKSTQS